MPTRMHGSMTSQRSCCYAVTVQRSLPLPPARRVHAGALTSTVKLQQRRQQQPHGQAHLYTPAHLPMLLLCDNPSLTRLAAA